MRSECVCLEETTGLHHEVSQRFAGESVCE